MKNTYYVSGHTRHGAEVKDIIVRAFSPQAAVDEIRYTFPGFNVDEVIIKCQDWK